MSHPRKLVTVLLMLLLGLSGVVSAQEGPPPEGVDVLPQTVRDMLAAELPAEEIRSVRVVYNITAEDGRRMTVWMQDGKVTTAMMRVEYDHLPDAVKDTVEAELDRPEDVRYIQKVIDPEGEGTYKLQWRGAGGMDTTEITADGTVKSMLRNGLKMKDLPEAAHDTMKALLGQERITSLQMHMEEGERTYRARTGGTRGYYIVGEDGELIKDPRGVTGKRPKNELP